MYINSENTQCNNALTGVGNSYTVEQLDRVVKVLLIHDDPKADPTQREVAAFWVQHFFYYLPAALRDKAQQTVAFIHERDFVGMV